MSKYKGSDNILLIPDAYMLEKRGYSIQLGMINLASKIYKWKNKKEAIFFRGASSGSFYLFSFKTSNQNFSLLNTKGISVQNEGIKEIMGRSSRYKIVDLSINHPEQVNARFSDYVQVKKSRLKEIAEHFGNVDQVNAINHLKYKYLASLDGNGCAWRRVNKNHSLNKK